MIKNVVFDIGNVLMGFDAQNYGAMYFKDPSKAKILQNAINSFLLWDKCDMGDRPVPEIIDEFATTVVGQEDMARQACYDSLKFVLHRDWSIPWVKELKAAGYKVYFLSNYNRYLAEQKPEILDFIPFMDGGVFSYEVHLLKPNKDIYEKLFASYGLKAEECVFLDDRVANVEAGKAIGMAGIVVENHEQAYNDLRKLLNY